MEIVLNRENILEVVTKAMRNISSNETLEVNDSIVFEDIDGWDSLNTVDLEMDLETNLDVSFATGEFQEYKSVKELIDALGEKAK
jgi:acyl carrier protein